LTLTPVQLLSVVKTAPVSCAWLMLVKPSASATTATERATTLLGVSRRFLLLGAFIVWLSFRFSPPEVDVAAPRLPG
jgi:hypothetical protein